MFFRSALLFAGAGLAIAQSLSSNCSSALLAVAASQDAVCLDLSLLAPLALSNSSTSVIPTVNSWLTGLCRQSACTNATLQTIVTNVTTGCASDLASLGLTTSPSIAVPAVQGVYPTIRQIGCLRDTSANTLCATELLTDVQSATGVTLSVRNITSLLTQAAAGRNISIPQNVTCSSCSKAAYTIATRDFPSLASNASDIQSECGSSFTDGQIPSSIQETTSNSSSSSNAAVPLSVGSLNAGVVMLIAVSSAFAVFA